MSTRWQRSLLTVLECYICPPLDELRLEYGKFVYHILNGLLIEKTLQSDTAECLNDRLEQHEQYRLEGQVQQESGSELNGGSDRQDVDKEG